MYSQNNAIKQWAEEDRPREKLVMQGRRALSNAELLSIIIGQGTRDMSAVALSRLILSDNNNRLDTLGSMTVADFERYKGIGKAKAISLVAAFEIGLRRQMLPRKRGAKISSSHDAFEYVNAQLSELSHEEFWVLFLNRGNRLIKIERISSGGVAGTVVDPKIIFKKALVSGASSMILVHNHPSGNLEPSEADRSITGKLVRAGEDLDIKVLDHLIVGLGEYYSFADEGKM